jgi:hypothetical protein
MEEGREKTSIKKIEEYNKVMSSHLSIVTLSVNELNSPIKRHGVADGQ